jgi:hypothetical protein
MEGTIGAPKLKLTSLFCLVCFMKSAAGLPLNVGEGRSECAQGMWVVFNWRFQKI